eukprot:m.125828 g.125828  ORF g.125828 m.125828 type:complete len:55 (+) comp9433_c4_seq1:1527-1691(+)
MGLSKIHIELYVYIKTSHCDLVVAAAAVVIVGVIWCCSFSFHKSLLRINLFPSE